MSVLMDLGLLDTPESESFDRITRMASRLLAAPIAAISLTDRYRQWFKSHIGTGGRELPREAAPCAEVTRSANVLVIPDLLLDPRFADSPLTRAGTRFYAGAPLITRDGYVLGSMCVLDRVPRSASADDVASLQDFAAMVMAQVELQHDFGRIDPQSNLPNRHQLVEDLQDMERASPNEARVAMLIDLMDSQQVSEMVGVLGAACVDDLIKASSRLVKDTLGRTAGLYHVALTSYVLLLNETESGLWREIMQKLTVPLTAIVSCSGVPIAMHPVFGISPFNLGHSGIQGNLLRTAMGAASDARTADLPYAVYSPASDEAHQRRFGLLTDFRHALGAADQLRLVFQPRMDIHTGQSESAEALLRWEHPLLGNISPGEFIPLVEQTALARPLTEWVVAAALDQIVEWQQAGDPQLRISINVSSRNLEEADFASRLATEMTRRSVSAARVELEFTEGALIRNHDKVMSQLGAIQAMGVEVAIDDFGTGYSNFSYLQKIPADTIKLDQSFMHTLGESSTNQQLVRSMVNLAHDLGLRVVAEGVETEAARDFLADCECDEIQGYFISRPLDPKALRAWLQTNNAPGVSRVADVH